MYFYNEHDYFKGADTLVEEKEICPYCGEEEDDNNPIIKRGKDRICKACLIEEEQNK